MVSKCKVYDSHKAGHMPKKAPLKQDFISAPMEKIASDIVGPLPESEKTQQLHIIGIRLPHKVCGGFFLA